MLTFLFTDIEGHTELWEMHPEGMSVALADCERLLESAISTAGGSVVKREGDAVMAVFEDPAAAVAAAQSAQRELAVRRWPDVGALHVRMGLHVGSAEHRDSDFYGTTVIRAARLCASAHGGQVVASAAVAAVTPHVTWVDLGEYRLRGLQSPERIHELVVDERKSFPALRDAESTHARLPRPRTSFVGRDEEISDGVALLSLERIVTLTGVGGSGKTRLAIEIARAALDGFPGGVVFVDLSTVTEPAQIEPELARTLGFDLSDRGAVDLRTRLHAYFARRRALVLLDNCEHLLDGCAELTDDLVEHCDGVVVLATTREPLRVDGERVVQVSSLTAEQGMELFRARAPVPVSDDTVVRQICERLDGMPLAIELAAARCRHFPLVQLASRLDDRFSLLTGGRRHIQRQQTLQATLDWSFDLLGDEEKALFPRLSVFAGSFSVEAGAAIGAADIAAPADTLASLVDCNLVEYMPADERYRLLETMRLYGEQKLLAAGETAASRDEHKKWFVGQVVAVPLDEAFVGCGRSIDLLPDIDNVRAVLRWSEEASDWNTIGQLVPRLVGVWIRTDCEEGADWAERALGHLDAADDRFGCIAAWIVLRLRRPPSAEFRPTADSTYTIAALTRELYTELISQARRRDDGFAVFMQGLVSPDLHAGGLASRDDSLRTVAAALIRESLERARRLSIGPVWSGFLRMAAGTYAFTIGDAAGAAREYSLALDTLEGTPATGYADLVAQLALALHLTQAPDVVAVAQRAIEESPSDLGWVDAHCALALELATAGDFQAAAAQLSHGGEPLDRCGLHRITEFLIAAAAVAHLSGDTRRAARWLGTAAASSGIFSTPAGFALYRSWTPRVREALEHDTAIVLRDQGRASTATTAAQEAIEWAGSVMPVA
jgi:predicted ATPase/class 3 adenylate cyclase